MVLFISAKEEEREENKDDDGVFGDSDWLPSSATSSSTLRHSTSLSSGSNGDSFSMAKKFPTRKHVILRVILRW